MLDIEMSRSRPGWISPGTPILHIVERYCLQPAPCCHTMLYLGTHRGPVLHMRFGWGLSARGLRPWPCFQSRGSCVGGESKRGVVPVNGEICLMLSLVLPSLSLPLHQEGHGCATSTRPATDKGADRRVKRQIGPGTKSETRDQRHPNFHTQRADRHLSISLFTYTLVFLIEDAFLWSGTRASSAQGRSRRSWVREQARSDQRPAGSHPFRPHKGGT